MSMEIKGFAATLGIGMVAGAAVMLMIPKRSAVYRTADRAARRMKRGVCRAVDSMTV